jgi:predicted RNA-binding Zn ribbon-like protein
VSRLAAIAVFALVLVAPGCGGGGGSTKAFCDSVHAGENPLDVFDRYDPTDVAGSRDVLQQGRDRLHQLEQAAPDEIRSSVHVLVGVVDQLLTALDPGNKAAPPDFTAQFQKVQTASATVITFARDHCAVDLDTASAPAS